MKHKQDPYSNEIYHLPIIVTESDIEREHIYNEYYNDEYWEKYNKKKLKKIIDYSKYQDYIYIIVV